MRRGPSRLVVACGAAAVFALAASAPSSAFTLQQVGPEGGYTDPTYVTSDPGNAGRLFVVEQQGRIMLTAGSQTSTFLDLTSVDPPIVQAGGEQGLLSMALAPDFAQSRRFYVAYTGTDEGTLHVDQLVAAGNTADPSSRRSVITVPHPTETNHNAGQLQFGPDGYLYVSTGDGGGGADPFENAQDITSLSGKILRIDPAPGGGHANPAGNPFLGSTPGRDEIWSYGLRNPWRFSFDRATGALVVADVGQGALEEIDYEPQSASGGGGDNFGWDCYEGTNSYEPAGCPPITSTTRPVFEYPHGPGCSITGGYVVRDTGVPDLLGRYVYSDYCDGEIHSLRLGFPATDDRASGISVDGPSSFGQDACGRVFVAAINSGDVSQIAGSGTTECTASVPDDQAPELRLGGKHKQKLRRRIKLRFSSDESAALDVGGRVTAGSGKRRLFGLRTKHRRLQAGVTTKVSWRLNKRSARRCRRLIRRHRRVSARFAFTATDATGNGTPTEHKRVRLVRR